MNAINKPKLGSRDTSATTTSAPAGKPNNSRKQAALGYAAEGFHIFPCKLDKSPYTPNGLNDATIDPAQIEQWWSRWPDANIGFVPGKSHLMVLDLDPGHDIAQLQEAVGGLPYTDMMVKTPRGGQHRYFELNPHEFVRPSASKIAPHVDVRSSASYVLLPPSATAAGPYEWVKNGEPGLRTDKMLAVANEGSRDKSETRHEWIIEPDLPQHVQKAIEWLKHEAKPAIEGRADQTTTAYATAAMLRSFGISEPKALDLMLEYWNPRCIPPWGDDAVEHFTSRIENAYRYSTSDPGNMTDAYQTAKKAVQFAPVGRTLSKSETVDGMEYTAGRFRVVDRDGMEHIPPVEWLIKGLLPVDSYAILFAPFGAFKTFIALDIALTIAAGGPIEDHPLSTWASAVPDEAIGPVLFAVGEGRSGITKRVKAWEAMHNNGERARDFFLADPVPLISEELEPFINAAKAHRQQYKLVVIDTVGRAMQGADENAQKEASKFTALVDTLRKELGCTVLALHHTGHGAADRERGSTVFGADADVRIRLDRQDKDHEVTLAVVKQKEDEEAKPVTITLAKHNFGPDDTSLVAVKPSASRASANPDRLPPAKRGKHDPKRNQDGQHLDVLDKAVEEVLREKPFKKWSANAIAIQIATRDDLNIDLGSARIRALITVLRDTKGTRTRALYRSHGEPPFYSCQGRF